MLRILGHPWLVSGLVAVVLAGGILLDQRGYKRGYSAHQAKVTVDTQALNDRLRRLDEQHRAVAEAYRREISQTDDLQRRLADEDAADPDVDRASLSAARVRRLNAIR